MRVAREAYKLAADVVRQNEISLRVGTLAPLDLQEAQSTEATNAAGVYQAENALSVARATLRQDLMLNPSHVFLPEQIEPPTSPPARAISSPTKSNRWSTRWSIGRSWPRCAS